MEVILSDSTKPHPEIKNFTPKQWEEMIDRLMGFTYKYFEYHFSGNILNAQTPDGSTYEDIAQEIVLKVLEGTRRWNPDKHGDLLPYMAGQVKSLVNHGLNSWSARNVDSVNENENEETTLIDENNQNRILSAKQSQQLPNTYKRKSEELNETEIIDGGPSKNSNIITSSNPEFVLIGYEYQVELDRLLETILDAATQTNDDKLLSMVEAYLDDSGKYKPGEIATRLGISTNEFYNRRKKLIRCVKKYLSKQSPMTGGRDDK